MDAYIKISTKELNYINELLKLDGDEESDTETWFPIHIKMVKHILVM